ncbi:hypothetical protein [Pontibacter anaerobius]|uniref:Uncharacterized protein n=1 Tax=Pontibacter anaerobius TaxID=2993940 RepID=A0ABT3RHP6_9BACT|nr:hypothetical protein [Pontibacter anaerobius]MCX2741075.1 hypothetical protein [Pontibacter anaerobius]
MAQNKSQSIRNTSTIASKAYRSLWILTFIRGLDFGGGKLGKYGQSIKAA